MWFDHVYIGEKTKDCFILLPWSNIPFKTKPIISGFQLLNCIGLVKIYRFVLPILTVWLLVTPSTMKKIILLLCPFSTLLLPELQGYARTIVAGNFILLNESQQVLMTSVLFLDALNQFTLIKIKTVFNFRKVREGKRDKADTRLGPHP